MTKKRIYGHTKSGKVIDDDMIQTLADEAERGYDVDTLITRRGQRGRPPLGSGASSVESFRIDDELKGALAARAEAEGVPASEILRRALKKYLKAG